MASSMGGGHTPQKPEQVFYKTRWCKHFAQNRCFRGKTCNFAHIEAEFFKTQLCPKLLTCEKPPSECRFAHSEDEMRRPVRAKGRPAEWCSTSTPLAEPLEVGCYLVDQNGEFTHDVPPSKTGMIAQARSPLDLDDHQDGCYLVEQHGELTHDAPPAQTDLLVQAAPKSDLLVTTAGGSRSSTLGSLPSRNSRTAASDADEEKVTRITYAEAAQPEDDSEIVTRTVTVRRTFLHFS